MPRSQSRLSQFQYTYERDSVAIYGIATATGPESYSLLGGGLSSLSQVQDGTPASYTGTPAGATTPVTITATHNGVAGDITLTGDGTSTITQLITAWNLANPSNTVSLTAGNGAQIPDNAEAISLTGGVDNTAGSLSLTLLDGFNKLMLVEALVVGASPSAVCYVQVKMTPSNMQAQSATASGSGGTLSLQLLNFAGAAVALETGNALMLKVTPRNSSLNAA